MLTAHEVYLPKPKLAVEGPGGVQASFDFRGREEHGRRSDAHGYAHERPRWEGIRMIDLSQPTAPFELELPYGLRVTVRPLTTPGMAAAQAAARRAVEAIEGKARERTEAGLPLDGLPALRPRVSVTASTRRSPILVSWRPGHVTNETGVEREGRASHHRRPKRSPR